MYAEFSSLIIRRLPLKLILVLCLISFNQSTLANANEQIFSKIKAVDSEYRDLSSEIYEQHALLLSNTKSNTNKSSYIDFSTALSKQIKTKQYFKAMTNIYKNLGLIKENAYNDSVITIVEFLLEQNDFNTASVLTQVINDEAEEYVYAKVKLLFAKYHNDRKEWQAVLSSLDIEFELLTDDDIAHAYLLKGIALQRLKQHRKAITFYEQVSKSSSFYVLAQINSALAYIRQDWWSDAHNIINNLLNNGALLVDEEMANRLFLILGYSLLNKEYYRESRESFRNISLDSQYTNKALLGISLAAIGQGDNNGALNTAKILNQKDSTELTRQESFLLLPHIYNSLEQYVTANTSYTVAINHYENAINLLNQQIAINASSLSGSTREDGSLDVNTLMSQFQLDELYPAFFFKNYVQLIYLKKNTFSEQSLTKIDGLLIKYNQLLLLSVENSLTQKIAAVQSYLSQARFGLAQLYDKDNE